MYSEWFCERDCPRGKWCPSRSRGLPCSVYLELRKGKENAKSNEHAANSIQQNNQHHQRLSSNGVRAGTAET